MKMMFNLSNGKWCFLMILSQSRQIDILSAEFLRIFLAIWFKFQRSILRGWVRVCVCVLLYQIKAISTARSHCQCRFVHLFCKNYTKNDTVLTQSIDVESVAMTLPRIVLPISDKNILESHFEGQTCSKRIHFTLINYIVALCLISDRKISIWWFWLNSPFPDTIDVGGFACKTMKYTSLNMTILGR